MLENDIDAMMIITLPAMPPMTRLSFSGMPPEIQRAGIMPPRIRPTLPRSIGWSAVTIARKNPNRPSTIVLCTDAMLSDSSSREKKSGKRRNSIIPMTPMAIAT